MGIDIGSTSVRTAVYDIKGQLVSLASCGTEKTMDENGFSETALLESVIENCNDALAKIDDNFHLHGIAVACIGCGSMLVDKNGKLVRTKGDYRSLAKKFYEQTGPNEVFNTTGYVPDESTVAFRIAAHSGLEIESVLSYADYLAFRLTGEKCREFSTACSMGTWDNHRGEWWDKLFAFTGVDKSKFGAVENSGSLVGTVLPSIVARSRIPRGTPVFTGGHDYVTSSFAAGCDSDRTILNITGTFEIMASYHDKPWQRVADNADPIRPIIDNHVIPGKFSFQTESYGAGQTEWLRKKILGIDDRGWGELFAQLDERENVKPSTELFIPHVYGQIVPEVNMDAKGAFLGLTEQTDRVSLLKASIEGLCFKAREMLEAQKKVTTPDFVLRMVGGGTKSQTWLQTKADICNIHIYVPNIKEATALGAAMLAGVGAGVYSSYDDAIKTVQKLGETIYAPRPNLVEAYEKIYHKYKEVQKWLNN